MLFDQFKVEQSNSLKSVMTGLKNHLRDVRKKTNKQNKSKNLDLKAAIERNTRRIKALEGRLSKRPVPPCVNSQTGMQSQYTTGHSSNAKKVEKQTQSDVLPKPQTPPTNKRSPSLTSTTIDTTSDSSSLNFVESKKTTKKQQLIALPAAYLTSE